MKPERWAQIEELFHRAAECAGNQRDVLLDQACHGDLELRREVEALLSSDSSARSRVHAAVDSEVRDFGFSLLGEVVSHYRILETLGGGGMGLVYRAEDIKLGRQVALKFLPEDSATDPLALARFEREARAASALEHPNICPIYEFGEHQGLSFLVMQLLEGQTLRELLEAHNVAGRESDSTSERTARAKASPFPLAQLLDIAIQISQGLEAAHRKGIIHRDIKPANIFVTSQGQAKILDFGLAKLAPGAGEENDDSRLNGNLRADRAARRSAISATPDPLLSRTGVAMGTAGYMSPEQARGEKLDVRSDIFSFGLVLYEMATGQRAFEGDTGPALHNAILTQTPVPTKQVNPQLPTKLSYVITKALEKNRVARYQTVSELRANLETVKRELEPKNRLRSLIAIGAPVLVLLLAGALLWFETRHQPSNKALPHIKFRQLTINSPENPISGGSISPSGQYLAYVDTQGIHVKDLETGAVRPIAEPPGLKRDSVNWEIMDAAWFPDNTRFIANAHAATDEPSTWSSRTSDIWSFSRENVPAHKIREHAIAWSVSADGKLISFGTNAGKLGERENWLMEPNGENAHKLFDAGENSSIGGFFWSTDSQRGFYVRTDASGDTVFSRDIHGGPPINFQGASQFLNVRGDISLLPDGRLIYQRTETGSGVNSAENTCNFWEMRIDQNTGKIIERPKQLTNWTGFCISSANPTGDGNKIAFLRNASQWSVYVADVDSGGIRIANMRRLTLDESWNMTQDWTNDSKNVLFTSNRTGHYAIYKQSLESDQPELISTGNDSFRDTPATPDGKWLFAIPWPQDSDQKDSNGLMRVPLSGGAPEFVTATLQDLVFCSRPPAKLCVLDEETADRKQLIFTSVDPVKGRIRELTRFALDPTIEYSDFDLSPAGDRLAVSGNTQGPIHILSLSGQPEQVIPATFNDSLEFHWAADGKGLYVPDQLKKATVLFYVDLHGRKHVLWEQRGGGWVWARPSPDGRHLAIESSSNSNNFWMMENF